MGSSVSSTSDLTSEIAFLTNAFNQNKVVLISKTYCPYCDKAKRILQNVKFGEHINYTCYEFNKMGQPRNGPMQQALKKNFSNVTEVPQLFVNGKFVGTYEMCKEKNKSGELMQIFKDSGEEFCGKIKTIIQMQE